VKVLWLVTLRVAVDTSTCIGRSGSFRTVRSTVSRYCQRRWRRLWDPCTIERGALSTDQHAISRCYAPAPEQKPQHLHQGENHIGQSCSPHIIWGSLEPNEWSHRILGVHVSAPSLKPRAGEEIEKMSDVGPVGSSLARCSLSPWSTHGFEVKRTTLQRMLGCRVVERERTRLLSNSRLICLHVASEVICDISDLRVSCSSLRARKQSRGTTCSFKGGLRTYAPVKSCSRVRPRAWSRLLCFWASRMLMVVLTALT